MIDNRRVGRSIAQLRQQNGLTQQQLASLMGVSHQAVSKWEGGAAIPDIQTLLDLTRFFGITVEQLINEDERSAADVRDATETDSDEEAGTETEEKVNKEVSIMRFDQLLKMAPFMSKETVEDIAMSIDGTLTATQLARIAPYLRPECVQALIEKHQPALDWDVLQRLAPFMGREAVDSLARKIASGEAQIKPSNDGLNKTINDIGKAFDDIGKGVGAAVQKAIRFGGAVIGEVSSAINDLSNDAQASSDAHVRSERAIALRKRAFERALKDGRWEWITAHLSELDDDSELKIRIANRAKEMGMHEWICNNMGGYADEFTIEAAISNGNWGWLGENAWRLSSDMQQRVALSAMRAENWHWLGQYSGQLSLPDCGIEIARTALSKGAKVLAAQIAREHLRPEQVDMFALEVYRSGDIEMLDLLAQDAQQGSLNGLLIALAEVREWELIKKYASAADGATAEQLMEAAVDQGNFDAVDLLDRYL